MTDKEVLEKTIQIAIGNGWRAEWSAKDEVTVYHLLLADISDDGLEVDLDANYTRHSLSNPKEFIFNHDFARSLWGEEPAPMKIWQEVNIGMPDYRTENRTVAYLENYRLKLMEMVVADNPLEYLRNNLPKEGS